MSAVSSCIFWRARPPYLRDRISRGQRFQRQLLKMFESQPGCSPCGKVRRGSEPKQAFFRKRGIDLTLPAIAVGGPEAAAGLIRGDWEFAHTGTVPIAEEVLKGHDVVILATPTSDFQIVCHDQKGNHRTCTACREKGGGANRDRADERGGADHNRKGGGHCDLFTAGEIRSNLSGLGRRRDRCGRASNRFAL